MELRPGSELGPWTVVRRLGSGGMGVVYLVRHRERDTPHALKILREVDQRHAVRLRAEGRLQAELRHPNVVGVTETAEVRGTPALVMEYVAGPTLAALLAARPALSLPEVDRVARGILRGVGAAHARGWVHRDLKPANVLLDRELVARVTDFGLASVADAEVGTLTRHGAGTRRYMSLEQLTGQAPDPSMDVFALGAVLSELLDGAPAFPTVHSWKEAIRTGRYPLPMRADAPARMVDAVRAALADGLVRIRDASALLAIWEGGVPEPVDPIRDETRSVLAAAVDLPERTWLPSDVTVALLPAERDGFVGRDGDLRAIADRLTDRLVTVHGPAGIGKTRLAVHFAWRERAAWRGGVWMCDLAEARDADGIVRAVARTFEVLLEGEDPVAQLGRAIASRGPCLVLLDNFEQVADHAAATLGEWSARAPEAAFLATSRIVLGLPGEQVVRVEPLADADAEALFVARAQAAHHAFDPSHEPEAIRRLVGLLDGLPLAIELCAARVRMMPPARIVERMSDRFRVLSGVRGRSDRHATLRAALDWSWELLTGWERSALAQCSVFAGGFGLDGFEAVVELSAWPDAPWPVDVAQALVDHSLLRVVAHGRFDLLASIRDYAEEKLAGETTAVQRRHAERFASLADAADTSGKLLVAELDNLAVAVRRSLGDDPIRAARASLGAAAVLNLRGPVRASEAMLDAVAATGALPPAIAARVAAARARVAQLQGRSADALALYAEGLEGFRAVGDRMREGRTLGALGTHAFETGDSTRAMAWISEALAIHRANGDRHTEGRLLSALAIVEFETGSPGPAVVKCRAALEIVREVGDREGESQVLGSLAHVTYFAGTPEESAALFEEALIASRHVGDRRQEGRLLTNLAHLHLNSGRLDRARECLDAATQFYREIGGRRNEGILASNLGALLVHAGRLEEAKVALEAAMAANLETGNKRFQSQVVGNMAILYGKLGDHDRADAMFEQAVGLFQEIDHPRGEAAVLVRWAEAAIEHGRVAQAIAAIERAEPLLLGAGYKSELARARCVQVRIGRSVGDTAGAAAALADAETLAAELGSASESPLGRILAEIRS